MIKSRGYIHLRSGISALAISFFVAVGCGAPDGDSGVEGVDSASQSPLVALSASFQPLVLSTAPEAPLDLRMFPAAVKTDSQGRIITGSSNDPIKNIVGAQAAGDRAGMPRFAKILFGAKYDTGSPNPGDRLDPNNPSLKSGSEHWPNRAQPFRSWPTSVAVTPDGAKLYVTLPGREGYPDWRVAVVDASARRVLRWIHVRPAEAATRGVRPTGVQISSYQHCNLQERLRGRDQ